MIDGICLWCFRDKAYIKLEGLFGEIKKVCFFCSLRLKDRGWVIVKEKKVKGCTCTVIQSHNEEGEIEFCSLHSEASKMLMTLKVVYAYFPTTDSPSEFIKGHGNWGLTNAEYSLVFEVARAITWAEGK